MNYMFLKKPVSLLPKKKNFKLHLFMIFHLADLENELNGAIKAVQIFTAKEHIVVTMEQEQSTEVSDITKCYSTVNYHVIIHYLKSMIRSKGAMKKFFD